MPQGSCRGKSSKEDLRICPSCASGALTALSQWKGKSVFVPKCRLFNWQQIFCVETGRVELFLLSHPFLLWNGLCPVCRTADWIYSIKEAFMLQKWKFIYFLILLLGSWTGQLRINFSEDKRQWIKVRRHGCDFQTDQRSSVSHLLEA